MFLTSSERVIKRHFMLFIYQNENVSVLGVYMCVCDGYMCVCLKSKAVAKTEGWAVKEI